MKKNTVIVLPWWPKEKLKEILEQRRRFQEAMQERRKIQAEQALAGEVIKAFEIDGFGV